MDISIRTRILYKLYGTEYIEAYRLDSILEVLQMRRFEILVQLQNNHKGMKESLIN